MRGPGTSGRWSAAAAPLGAELFLGYKATFPAIAGIDPSLSRPWAQRLCRAIREHSHQFQALQRRHYGQQIVAPAIRTGAPGGQRRHVDSRAWACVLSEAQHASAGRQQQGRRGCRMTGRRPFISWDMAPGRDSKLLPHPFRQYRCQHAWPPRKLRAWRRPGGQAQCETTSSPRPLRWPWERREDRPGGTGSNNFPATSDNRATPACLGYIVV